jgi:hypothetical protein
VSPKTATTPLSLFVVDGTVLLWLCSDGIALSLVVSEGQRVNEWAVDRFETFHAAGESVIPGLSSGWPGTDWTSRSRPQAAVTVFVWLSVRPSASVTVSRTS